MMASRTFDFVGRSRTWLTVSAALVLISFLALGVRGLSLSIDFVGGTSFVLDGVAGGTTAGQLRDAAAGAGAEEPIAQLRIDGGQATGATVRTQAFQPGSDEATAIRDALVESSQASDAEVSFVGPSWGERISRSALEALVVFLLVVVAYISMRLEFKMAMAAILALAHDIVITVGLYALVGFTVSPSTVIALLTILGYSLYDTVVVFDRIQENAAQLGEPGRRTYAEMVNTSMNEVLGRSLNTSVTSLLPVGALLFIGSQLLGADTLADLALALFIGMAVGVYSSLFVASPFLAWWKEREPEHARRARRLQAAVEAGDEPASMSMDAVIASRAPITTDYVRGEGKRRRRKR